MQNILFQRNLAPPPTQSPLANFRPAKNHTNPLFYLLNFALKIANRMLGQTAYLLDSAVTLHFPRRQFAIISRLANSFFLQRCHCCFGGFSSLNFKLCRKYFVFCLQKTNFELSSIWAMYSSLAYTMSV